MQKQNIFYVTTQLSKTFNIMVSEFLDILMQNTYILNILHLNSSKQKLFVCFLGDEMLTRASVACLCVV